jgi:RpiR family transcriptional regulator, carbohydrate utilization regulator
MPTTRTVMPTTSATAAATVTPTVAPILTHVKNQRDALAPAEQRVAELVLKDAESVIAAPIADLATRAGVSQPTVVRFCRSLGYSGFPEFRLALARAMALDSASGVPYVHRDVSPKDKPRDVISKVFHRAAGTLTRVAGALDARAFEGAIAALSGAQRIEFYGLGNSAVVAQDAQYKFFRLGVPAVHYADSHMNILSAPLLKRGDVVVAISASGRTRELCRAAELARDAGARVIALTTAGSPLARLAHVVLNAEVDEDPDLYSPMTSRIAHLAIIDALAVSVALKRGAALARALEKSKQALKTLRFPRQR